MKAFLKKLARHPIRIMQRGIEPNIIERRRIGAAKKAAELHGDYAREKGYYKKVVREVSRFFQITSLKGLGKKKPERTKLQWAD